ncbi:MAG: sulfatase [Promethearchaeota archaeon]|nr:MAG: sulfatase [Candidatus Lokiarchaeota archaeon]
MKVILILYDTLNRHYLPPYGCDWVHAPNFKRLAEKTVIFDNCFAGSLPCIPARRELHTGRYNFLHRSWSPLEPFDDSMPNILKNNKVYAHLVSDHYHYWEDGGATYHTQYSSWEIIRGHEGDPWKGEVKDPEIPNHVSNMREDFGVGWRQDWVNRKYMQKEESMPQAVTFKKGLEFIETNFEENNWFLQIESFDPHEPFVTPQKYKDLYNDNYDGPHFDWPNYGAVTETSEQVEHCRKEYAASVSMCDHYLGKILDIMDEKNMWNDTMLIVTTDHGFLLGEKGWWAKMVQPIYNEIAHIPLFIWDPRSAKKNERRKALVQTIDYAPTILEFFGISPKKDMQGKVLKDTINNDNNIRSAALFGVHSGHVNVTDGNYTYMRGPTNPLNKPIFNYTLMPTHMRNFFSISELKEMALSEPFTFSKGCKMLKIPRNIVVYPYIFGSLLFDLKKDPTQENPIIDLDIETKMIKVMVELMKENDAPIEQYNRLGIPIEGNVKKFHLNLEEQREGVQDKIGDTEIVWRNKGKSMYYSFLLSIPPVMQSQVLTLVQKEMITTKITEIDEDFLIEIFKRIIPKGSNMYLEILYQLVKKGK